MKGVRSRFVAQKLKAPELERAGESVPACQSLNSTPSP